MVYTEGLARLSDGLLKGGIETSTEAVEFTDSDSRVIYVNEEWCRLFSRVGNRVIATRWDVNTANNADLKLLMRTWAQCLATGHSCGVTFIEQVDGAALPVSFNRWRHSYSGGCGSFVVTVYSPVVAGTPAGGSSVGVATTIRGAFDAMALFNMRGYLIVANPAFAGVSGFEADTGSGLHLQSFFPMAQQLLLHVAEGDSQWCGVLRMVRKDGRAIKPIVALTPCRQPAGNPLGLAVQTSSMAMLGASVPGDVESPARTRREVEHEIRSTLAAITSIAGLIERTVADRVLHHRLGLIMTAAGQCVSLLDGIENDCGG